MDRQVAIVLEVDSEAIGLARSVLLESGLRVEEARTAEAALDGLRAGPVAMVLAATDVRGFETGRFASRLSRLRPSAVLLVLEEGCDARRAFDLVRLGAFDALPKPLERDRLRLAIERALAEHRLLEEMRRVRAAAREERGCGRLVGRSEAALALRETLAALALGEGSVLLVGEPGTGKELCARVLHELSPQCSRPFAAVRCAERSAAEIVSELAASSAGTVFLDDVASLSAEAQKDLAEALGGGGSAWGRLVASASVSDLDRALATGRLREDLCRRLAGAVVRVPPLRLRGADVLLLARHFLEGISAASDLPPLRLSSEVAELLQRYAWPGNVRELRDAIEQAALVCREGTIEAQDLPAAVRSALAGVEGRKADVFRKTFRQAKEETIRSFERAYLVELMRRHRGNVTEAAQEAGLIRSALQRLLRRHGLRSSAYRSAAPPPDLRP
jgi:DNA-binding NtrC family response regulator